MQKKNHFDFISPKSGNAKSWRICAALRRTATPPPSLQILEKIP